jgi:hypothetical protein
MFTRENTQLRQITCSKRTEKQVRARPITRGLKICSLSVGIGGRKAGKWYVD